MIIDAPVLTEPRTWRISKVNRISSNGLGLFTLAQDVFDQHKDYVEIDDYGNVIGMWADYYSSSIIPEDYSEEEPQTTFNIKMSYLGLKPEVKIGGSYKTIVAKLYDGETEIPIIAPGTWSFYIMNEDVSSLINSKDNEDGTIKIKFLGDISYINKILTVQYTSSDGISESIDIEIKRL